jgi:hypothetical protein
LFRSIKRSSCNLHSYCSVLCCGFVGKKLYFDCEDSTGTQAGTFIKDYGGICNELCAAADTYEVSLPDDENEAALILATVQMVDMLYFEQPWGCLWP